MEETMVPVTKKFLKKYGVNVSLKNLLDLANKKNYPSIFWDVKWGNCIYPDSWERFERKLVKGEIEREIKEEIREGVKELVDTLIKEAFQEIKRLLAEAHERKDLTIMPGFPRVPKEEPQTRWITMEEQEAILSHCREPYRTLFLFCLKQGCRIGEARALKWDWVNLKEKTVTIAARFDLGT